MDDSLRKAIELEQALVAAQNLLNQRIKDGFRGKNIETIKKELNQDTDSVLQYLIEISLPTEDFEICEAARQILQTRKTSEP